MYIIRLIQLFSLCIMLSISGYSQNILNQYDNKGRKHGQWLESGSIILNYNHGDLHGVGYQLNGKGNIVSVSEYNYGEVIRITLINDNGQLLGCLTDFVNVDTIVVGRDLTHHFKKRFKLISYHPNGVIKSIKTEYLLEGDDPEIDSFEIGKAYYYDEKGNLIETKELFSPTF